LQRGQQRNVRASLGVPAERIHSVSSAQSLWLREIVQLLDDRQRARRLRLVRREWDLV
jgi:hypothetical protein